MGMEVNERRCRHCDAPLPGHRDTRARYCDDLCKGRGRRSRRPPEYAKRLTVNMRRWRAKNLYGLTLEELAEMKTAQQGCCAICQRPSDELQIDHSHATTKVRALLCPKCNRGLGHFDDDVELLKAAIAYLKRHKDSDGNASRDTASTAGDEQLDPCDRNETGSTGRLRRERVNANGKT
jgi:Recombination endonuclease VII